MGLGDAVIPGLIDIMTDEELGDDEAIGDGYAPIHAARRLGTLRAEAAVLPMFELLRQTDWDTMIHDTVIQALPKIGAPVLEPALRIHRESNDPELRSDAAYVLAECGVRDERIYQLLVDHLAVDAALTANNLAEYGDPRALPHLLRVFDQLPVEDEENWVANQDLIELRDAIETLGGTLTVELHTCSALDGFLQAWHSMPT